MRCDAYSLSPVSFGKNSRRDFLKQYLLDGAIIFLARGPHQGGSSTYCHLHPYFTLWYVASRGIATCSSNMCHFQRPTQVVCFHKAWLDAHRPSLVAQLERPRLTIFSCNTMIRARVQSGLPSLWISIIGFAVALRLLARHLSLGDSISLDLI